MALDPGTQNPEAGWGETGLSVARRASPLQARRPRCHGALSLGCGPQERDRVAGTRSLPAGTNPRGGWAASPAVETGRARGEGRRPACAYPSASLGGSLVRSSPPSVGLPAPGGSPPVSGHGPVPSAPNCASNCPRSRLPFPLAGEDGGDTCHSRRGRGAGRSPRQNSPGLAGAGAPLAGQPSRPLSARAGPGRREARLGGRGGGRRAGSAPRGSWKVPKPSRRRLRPAAPSCKRDAASGRGSRRALEEGGRRL